MSKDVKTAETDRLTQTLQKLAIYANGPRVGLILPDEAAELLHYIGRLEAFCKGFDVGTGLILKEVNRSNDVEGVPI